MKGSNPAKTDRAKANASATRAVPLAQLDVVDSDRRRRLPGPPFLAVQSSHNGPVLPHAFDATLSLIPMEPNLLTTVNHALSECSRDIGEINTLATMPNAAGFGSAITS